MEPIGIFILAMLCQFYSCAANVSDSVERMQYASVAGEEYLQGDKLETNLDDKVYFDFDKSSLDAEEFSFSSITSSELLPSAAESSFSEDNLIIFCYKSKWNGLGIK